MNQFLLTILILYSVANIIFIISFPIILDDYLFKNDTIVLKDILFCIIFLPATIVILCFIIICLLFEHITDSKPIQKVKDFLNKPIIKF